MQNLDPTGVYTNDEVKEALSGASGVRDWDFRYEHLDANNNFIENLDTIQKCTIDNNALADIKRTAKFDILDTGTINYLKDRIKPYARITMPADKSYDEYVQSQNPSVWFKFNGDNSGMVSQAGYTVVSDGLTYNTFGTALQLNSITDARRFNIQFGSSTLRSEIWFKFDVDGPLALDMESNVDPVTNTYRDSEAYYYYQSGTTQADLKLVGTGGVCDVVSPKAGKYYIRVVATGALSSSIINIVTSYSKYLTATDTISGNQYLLGGMQYTTGLIQDGGSSVVMQAGNSKGVINPDASVKSTPIGPVFNGQMSMNFWASVPQNWDNYGYVYATGTVGATDIGMAIDRSGTQANTVRLYLYTNTTSYNVAVNIPLSTVSGTHHYSMSVSSSSDFSNLIASIYLDGKLLGTATAPYSSTLTQSIRTGGQYVAPRIEVVGQVGMDDVSFYFNRSLTDTEMRGLYLAGSTAKPIRRGYVEWPQGVFLLSSPTRTMKEGNEIVREVEAYDQLLALKEDSYDTRKAFVTGTRYTDAVAQVLNSQLNIASHPLDTSDVWKSDSNVANGVYSIDGPDKMTLSTLNLTLQSKNGSTYFEGSSLSMKIPYTNVNGDYFQMYLCAEDPALSNDYYGWVGFDLTPGVLNIGLPGQDTVYAYGTYDPTAHAYLRVRESAGTIYYEVSPDGSTWNTIKSVPNPYSLGVNSHVNFQGTHMATQVAITSFKYTAADTVKRVIPASSSVMPAAMEWEPGTSKLTVINDLLSSINYESAWYDENGYFVARPYIAPSNRGSEFNYMTDANSVIVGDIDQTVDLFKIPNKWIVVVSEPDRPALTGTYTNSDPASPTSTVARGRTIVDFRTEQKAPDQVTLDALAARLAFEASQVYEKIEFGTGLMPIHSNFDTYTLGIDGLAVKNKYSETAWSMELDPGSVMKHTVRRIVNV